MNEKDKGGSGLLIRGRKQLDEVRVPIYSVDPASGYAYEVANIPMDRGVTRIYQSRAGGLVPPTAAGDSCLSQLHYGEGWFEGMRFYDSENGAVLIRPWMNYARFMHSATVFNPKFAELVRDNFSREDGPVRMMHRVSLTSRKYYDIAEENFSIGKDMAFPVILEYSGGRQEEIMLKMAMQVAGSNGKTFEMTMGCLDTIVKVLAFTGGLVSSDYFPKGIEMMPAGYIRPWGWISGEDGLKIPSIKVSKENGLTVIRNKPTYVAVATLPWGLYLNEKDYERGLDVLVSPYTRINDDTMPSNAKVAGNYVNSLMAINMGLMFGFGEILAFNREKKFVEGSAENAFVFMEENGKLVAYTPDTRAGCLPGTTRDGVVRSIENLGIEVRYAELELRHLYDARAILLTGTGAQMIHVRSITELDAADKIADAVRLRSEGLEYVQNEISRRDFQRRSRLINNGERHPILSQVQEEYRKLCLEKSVSVADIQMEPLCELLSLDKKDFLSRKESALVASGYFHERVNGLTQPDELATKLRAMARILHKALKKSPNPGIPLKDLQNGSKASRIR